jgi:D-glycero-D-manno-heptose 1,7-bisphosphate phosphatase
LKRRGNSFVILDRDGTIIEERHYLSNPDAVQLIPRAVEGLRHMQTKGVGLIVVTNQSALGRGLFNEARLAEIHARMEGLLEAEGVHLDGIFVYPHTPEDNFGANGIRRTGGVDGLRRT